MKNITRLESFSIRRSFLFFVLFFFFIFSVFLVSSKLSQADSDFLTASTVVNGSGSSGWQFYDNSRVSDDSYAIASKQERQVYFSDFNIPVIPAGAVIKGIEVSIEGQTEGRDVAAAISWNKSKRMSTAIEAGFVPASTDSIKIVGSPNDLSVWGNHIWTPEDFSNENFHIRLQSGEYKAAKETKFFLDSVMVKVYYTLPVITCTAWTYSDWGECQPEGIQIRTILSSYPENCVGGEPEALIQTCEYVPPVTDCVSWVYSDWSECSSEGIQTRTILSALPEGCIGGLPEPLSQTCEYLPPTPTCTAWTYSDWGECFLAVECPPEDYGCLPLGAQTREILASYPEGCVGGMPEPLIQNCFITPPQE